MYNIIKAEATDYLTGMQSKCVDCCITSPPYYNLRDYGIEPTVWDGDPNCRHEWANEMLVNNTCGGWKGNPDYIQKHGIGRRNPAKPVNMRPSRGRFCVKCGAWLGCLGLEPHVDIYIEHLRQLCRQIHRVLKPTGTFWLNIGDTYCSERPGSRDPARWPKQARNDHKPAVNTYNRGVKRKELFLVPARISLALQEDGWYVRQDIIWSKRNCMPENCTDRCTKSHEYVFLLTKTDRYYFNHKAIQEPMVEYERQRRLREKRQGLNTTYKLARDGNTGLTDQSKAGACRTAAARHKLAESGLRNKRSVWVTSAARFKGAHFATFPPALVEPMIKAGCVEGGLILDPCCGTGTTGEVAIKLGRDFIGIDPKKENCDMAERRCSGAARLLSH